MVMYLIMLVFDGKILDDEKYNCVISLCSVIYGFFVVIDGKKNFFEVFIEVVVIMGCGYVIY